MALNTMIKKELKKDPDREHLDAKLKSLHKGLAPNSPSEVANLNTINLDQFNKSLLNENRLEKDALLRCVDSLRSNVKMLKKRKITPPEAADQLVDALQSVRKDIIKQSIEIGGSTIYPAQVVEKMVFQKAPDLAKYLMLQHSYADYANGDLKAFVLNSYKAMKAELSNLYHKIVEQAEEHIKTSIPVKIRGAIVQATSLAHYLLGFARALERDSERCDSFMKIADSSPYCAYQGAGTSFNINPDMVARHMGFSKSESNSHNALSDRSYVTDLLYNCCTIHNTLSGIASDLMEWASPGNDYIRISNTLIAEKPMQLGVQEFSSLELVRSQAALSNGKLSTALNILSNGKSGTYQADFELLPELAFSTYEHLMASLRVCTLAISNIEVDKSRTKEASINGYALANDLYEWLVVNTSNSPQECTKITKCIIDFAHKSGKKLSLVELEKMQEFCPEITKDVYSALVASRSIIAKRSYGGSNPVQVRKAIRHAKKKLV